MIEETGPNLEVGAQSKEEPSTSKPSPRLMPSRVPIHANREAHVRGPASHYDLKMKNMS